jgi:hypothetical protein
MWREMWREKDVPRRAQQPSRDETVSIWRARRVHAIPRRRPNQLAMDQS